MHIGMIGAPDLIGIAPGRRICATERAPVISGLSASCFQLVLLLASSAISVMLVCDSAA